MAKAGSTWERQSPDWRLDRANQEIGVPRLFHNQATRPTLKPRYSRVNPRRRNDHTANKKHTSA
jgi:hypothetical protein